MAHITLIAAVARNGVIGRDGGLAWRHPADMAHFREVTHGHAVVMGRRTWDSLPERFRPLPARRNVVLTRQAGWAAQGAEAYASLDEALHALRDLPEVFVIGGGEVYAQAMPVADRLILTEIGADLEGDVRFPEIPAGAFEVVARTAHAGPPDFAFVTCLRRRA